MEKLMIVHKDYNKWSLCFTLEGLAELIRKFAPFRVSIALSQTQLARGSRQNSVHAGAAPKTSFSPLHARTNSKNVYLRRPPRFHASDPLPIFLAISLVQHASKSTLQSSLAAPIR